MTQESYDDMLRRHSSASRYDPLRDAARRVLTAWDADDEQEKNDLSDELWQSMRGLRKVLTSAKRGGEEEVPEVEVTPSAFRAAHEDAGERLPTHVEAPETPVAARRSGAKNVSAPEYQNAFISEARASMGQPGVEDAKALLNKLVIIEFNDDKLPVQGVLTTVTAHPTQRTYVLVVKVLADPSPPGPMFYPLNSIQSIKEVAS